MQLSLFRPLVSLSTNLIVLNLGSTANSAIVKLKRYVLRELGLAYASVNSVPHITIASLTSVAINDGKIELAATMVSRLNLPVSLASKEYGFFKILRVM